MELTTYKVLTGLAYITLIFIATFVSWKKGEKVGSVFMLQYLRENKFMNDSDYNKFMRHVRSERRSMVRDRISSNLGPRTCVAGILEPGRTREGQGNIAGIKMERPIHAESYF